MPDNEIADSTDWLSTPLSALTPLESALRCQICKDFYETPMITTCSHTFCSLCIRRALSAEGKCPLCRNNEQELKLRSNWSMEEAVEAFKKARADVLALARRPAVEERSPKRKADEVEEEEEKPVESKRLRSSARLSQNATRSTPSYAPEVVEDDEVIPISDHEDEYVPEPADGLVPCPSCQQRMKEWQVFAHLGHCPGPEPAPKANPQSDATSQISASRQHQKTLDRLPALNYGMYKDNALRKKLQDLGLSSYGPRILMEKRHKEWITLWNANCDAARPKKRNELLHDLEMWERTQGGRANTTGMAARNAAMIKDKDFDGGAWAMKHDTSFKDLIANARKSVQAKQQVKEEDSAKAPMHTDTAMNGDDATTSADPTSMHAEEQHSNTDTGMGNTDTSTNGVPQLTGAASGIPNGSHNETQPKQDSHNTQTDVELPHSFDPITWTFKDTTRTFSRAFCERIRTGSEPTPDKVERWRHQRAEQVKVPREERTLGTSPGDEDFKLYVVVMDYLRSHRVSVRGGYVDFQVPEAQGEAMGTRDEMTFERIRPRNNGPGPSP